MWFSASGRTIILVSEEVKFIRIFAGDTPSGGAKVRHSHIDSENLTNIGHNLETVQDRPILRVKCSRKNLVFNNISLMATFAGNHPQRGRYIVATPLSLLASENLTMSHNSETVQDRTEKVS